MTRTAVKVDVWNKALINIGETELLEDPDDNGRVAAAIANKNWEDVLEEVLAAHPWQFAKKQVALSFAVAQYDETTTYALDNLVRDDDGKVYQSLQAGNLGNGLDDTNWWAYQYDLGAGWGYVYTLPNDCVTPLWLLAEGERSSQVAEADRKSFAVIADADLELSLLACDYDIDDEDFQCLEYIARHEYVPGWPRAFVEAVTWRMARVFALGLQKDPSVSVKLCDANYDAALSRARGQALRGEVQDPELDTPSLQAR